MTTLDQKSKSLPRWKEILDQMLVELPSYDYGSSFYTITDLCQKFDVSRITAIRVLNELSQRHLIEKLPGKGNVVRQTKGQAFVRLIIPSYARPDYVSYDPVNRRLIEGVTHAARELGLNFDSISEAHLQRLFPQAGSNFGFLVPKAVSLQTRDFLRAHRLPHVLLDPWENHKHTSLARVDRFACGYIATQHLLSLGHTRIAFINGPISSLNFRDRLKGYRRALQEAGLKFRWEYILETDGLTPVNDEAALEQLHRLRHPPTAIVLGDDSRGIHLLQACQRLGLRVPEDLSLVGFPNTSESSLTQPPLTVIDACYESVGQAGVKLVMDAIFAGSSAQTEQVVLQPKLVVRGSTGPAARTQNSTRSLHSKSNSIRTTLVPSAAL